MRVPSAPAGPLTRIIGPGRARPEVRRAVLARSVPPMRLRRPGTARGSG
jgi:hypothetical protein